MEESIKYFQPEISDIRVGYEYYSDKNGSLKHWVVNQDQFEQLDPSRMLVLYLTKEQIINDEWEEYKGSWPYLKNRFGFTKGNYFLMLDLKGKTPFISIGAKDVTLLEWLPLDPESFRITIPCPSINEFRTICKWLNIK